MSTAIDMHLESVLREQSSTAVPYFPVDNAHLMYNAHRRFFPFTEHFFIYNARVIDGKIR
jgi:hypothetical protein